MQQKTFSTDYNAGYLFYLTLFYYITLQKIFKWPYYSTFDFSQFLTNSVKLYEIDGAIYRLQMNHNIYLQLIVDAIVLGFGFRVRSRDVNETWFFRVLEKISQMGEFREIAKNPYQTLIN